MFWKKASYKGAQGTLTSQLGFTLLELLVAVSIMALMLAILYQTFGATIRATETANEESDIYQMAHLGFSIMTDELQSTFWSKDRPDTFFVGSADSLRFTALSRHRYGEGVQGSELAALHYYLEVARADPGEEPRLTLFHEEETNLFSLSSASLQRTELVEMVHEFSLGYLVRKSWIDSWDAGERGKLPEAVDIRLTLKDRNDREHAFSTRIQIPIESLD
jgi:prepilin-type N-terminal cleavage/methylation domain-containing protein